MASMPYGAIGDGAALSVAEKVAVVSRALPGARVRWAAAAPVRALSFTRQAPGSMRELPGQRAVFLAACARRGWQAGGSVGQIGGGLRAWSSVVRLVQSGSHDVVVVESFDRLGATEVDRVRVLWMLRRAGVRLLLVRDEIDTGDPIGLALVDSLISAGRATVSR
jgi:hypothetical protein